MWAILDLGQYALSRLRTAQKAVQNKLRTRLRAEPRDPEMTRKWSDLESWRIGEGHSELRCGRSGARPLVLFTVKNSPKTPHIWLTIGPAQRASATGQEVSRDGPFWSSAGALFHG